MKFPKRITLILISLTLSCVLLKVEFKAFDEIDEGLFSNIVYPFLNLCFIGIGLFSFIRFIKKWDTGYLIVSSNTFITAIVVILIWQKINTRETSNIEFKAQYDDGIHFTTLTLRKNRTYKLEDYGYYGGRTYFGDYWIKGDTIVLSKKHSWGTESPIIRNRLLMESGYVLAKTDSKGNFHQNDPYKMTILYPN